MSVNKPLIGSACALVSAIAFALNLVLAGMSYQHGANVHSLNLVRAVLFLCSLAIYILATRTSFSLPTRARNISFLVGVLLCTEMYVLLGAIVTVPVALAVLIFYTYPIIIACWKWTSGEETFTWAAFVLMLAGFCGLFFVLINTPPSQLEIIGISLAIVAALVMAAMLITSEHNLVRYNNQVVLFYSLAMVVAIIVLSSLVAVDLNWPSGTLGWLVFLGSSIFYVVATFTLFKAVSLVGPLRTAIIDNTAPVWAILFGYILLAQSLTPKQIGGALVVIVAVMLLQLVKRR